VGTETRLGFHRTGGEALTPSKKKRMPRTDCCGVEVRKHSEKKEGKSERKVKASVGMREVQTGKLALFRKGVRHGNEKPLKVT